MTENGEEFEGILSFHGDFIEEKEISSVENRIFKEFSVNFREKSERKEAEEMNWTVGIPKEEIILKKNNSKNKSYIFKAKSNLKLSKKTSYEFQAVICLKNPIFIRIKSNLQSLAFSKKQVTKIPLKVFKENEPYYSASRLLKDDGNWYLSKTGIVKDDWVIWEIIDKSFSSLETLKIKNDGGG